MSIAFHAFVILLYILGYLITPISIVWGWARLARHEWHRRKIMPMLTLCGFVLATASALLAIGTVIYAQFHHFPFYDPLLMKIFGAGFLLSIGSLFLGIFGIWRPSSLRYHAPISAIATAAFWFVVSMGE